MSISRRFLIRATLRVTFTPFIFSAVEPWWIESLQSRGVEALQLCSLKRCAWVINKFPFRADLGSPSPKRDADICKHERSDNNILSFSICQSSDEQSRWCLPSPTSHWMKSLFHSPAPHRARQYLIHISQQLSDRVWRSRYSAGSGRRDQLGSLVYSTMSRSFLPDFLVFSLLFFILLQSLSFPSSPPPTIFM